MASEVAVGGVAAPSATSRRPGCGVAHGTSPGMPALEEVARTRSLPLEIRRTPPAQNPVTPAGTQSPDLHVGAQTINPPIGNTQNAVPHTQNPVTSTSDTQDPDSPTGTQNPVIPTGNTQNPDPPAGIHRTRNAHPPATNRLPPQPAIRGALMHMVPYVTECRVCDAY
ncbi:uncharacterized protein NECHADRAFT_76641 [Fusarium vanettenii 77-13-4]|uniref:Uncharacterized protein n=1 Tax=Fusarium vanettenii (strain ATCC MYA-4622 / CBS 123669 / FGSC 9596 / NRRL 45880 / 77-13-4) TaxID=660122 RepID=C7Z4U6_FUSV7|nr:uncharacterized protein NECHADRAFT_76641 [Fusarium vanettenii 77-13-4]EEU40985.1 hypothetical protein NECHADRAFT_76641 [Fusarium vanettenii 77-13-4]